MKLITRVLPPASTHWVGDGFPVQNLISIERDAREVSPFLMLDYAAPYEFAPAAKPRGVGEHPHRGFETITLAYEGEVAHQDSGGGSGVIRPGDVQWMTAGRGVVHEEFHSEDFTRRGGKFSMAQLWINLPAKDKMTPPRYQTLRAAQIPVVKVSGGTLRVIAGEFAGNKGPALTHSPLNVWDLRLNTGAEAVFAIAENWTALAVVLRGRVISAAREISARLTAQYAKAGDRLQLQALEDSHLLLLSGQPLDEPIAAHGPFVMNTRAEIVEAMKDYGRGNFGRL